MYEASRVQISSFENRGAYEHLRYHKWPLIPLIGQAIIQGLIVRTGAIKNQKEYLEEIIDFIFIDTNKLVWNPWQTKINSHCHYLGTLTLQLGNIVYKRFRYWKNGCRNSIVTVCFCLWFTDEHSIRFSVIQKMFNIACRNCKDVKKTSRTSPNLSPGILQNTGAICR